MHNKPYRDLNSYSIIINLDLFSFQNKLLSLMKVHVTKVSINH